jgi:glycosyltransferase involved in cell wall biosynthesis
VISAGRTGRDFVTFGRAVTQTTCPATIVCASSYVSPEFKEFGPNVTVLAHPNPIHYSYRDLLDMYVSAAAIAIPMVQTPALCGLTSLLDALGMGRAVIMTRNPLIDIDVEVEKIGFWIAPGDTQGWQRAVQFVADHPDEIAEMGRRARRIAEERYNSRLFAAKLLEIVDRALAGKPAANLSGPAT